jgi:RecA-family ATPase
LAAIECRLLAVVAHDPLDILLVSGGDNMTTQEILSAPGNLDFVDAPIPASISKEELKTMMQQGLAEEKASLTKEPPKKSASKNATSPATGEEKQPANKIYSCREFLSIVHKNTTPLIGKEGDALLVRGECLMIPGTGGVGKTLLLDALAFNLVTGETFLKWQVQKALKVLIYQAELPAAYYQKRLQPLFDVYALGDPQKAELINENLFIAEMHRPFSISGDEADITGAGTGFSTIIPDIESLKIDVVIIDPFLSFFRGNENDNNEVRRALDNIKREVAEKYQCGLIISDHMPKYAGSEKNVEQAYSMRGASAKRDWAASVVALTKMKTPDGQHGTFIQATVDKMRYGKMPKNPFSLRRDDFSFRHDLIKNNDIPLHDIARILDEAGNDKSKRDINKAVAEAFSISDHEARNLIESAVEDNWIVTSPGKNRAIIHSLGERYFEHRNDL